MYIIPKKLMNLHLSQFEKYGNPADEKCKNWRKIFIFGVHKTLVKDHADGLKRKY